MMIHSYIHQIHVQDPKKDGKPTNDAIKTLILHDPLSQLGPYQGQISLNPNTVWKVTKKCTIKPTNQRQIRGKLSHGEQAPTGKARRAHSATPREC